jgi:hypothetical protein
MFDVLGDLFDRDGRRKQHGRATGLRGMIQRLLGGDRHDDHRGYSRRSYRDDDDDDDRYEYRGRRRRRYGDDDDDD